MKQGKVKKILAILLCLLLVLSSCETSGKTFSKLYGVNSKDEVSTYVNFEGKITVADKEMLNDFLKLKFSEEEQCSLIKSNTYKTLQITTKTRNLECVLKYDGIEVTDKKDGVISSRKAKDIKIYQEFLQKFNFNHEYFAYDESSLGLIGVQRSDVKKIVYKADNVELGSQFLDDLNSLEFDVTKVDVVYPATVFTEIVLTTANDDDVVISFTAKGMRIFRGSVRDSYLAKDEKALSEFKSKYNLVSWRDENC